MGVAIRRIEGLLRKDPSFGKALERMEENVVKGQKTRYDVPMISSHTQQAAPPERQ
jgi:hypothetical protein